MNSSADENGIREAINYYIEGMRTATLKYRDKAFISKRSSAVTSAMR